MDIGSLVATLGMDLRDFEKGIKKSQKLLLDISKTSDKVTDSIEKDWNKIGSRSTKSIDKMKADIMQSYCRIASHASSSNADIVRAHTSAMRKIAAINKRYLPSISDEWKKLGTKSSKSIQKMKDDIIIAYNRIKTHAKSSSNDIIRAKAAMVKRLKAIDKEYAKTTKKELKKIESSWVSSFKRIGAGIAMYLSIGVLRDVTKEIVQAGIRIQSLENSLRAVTGSSAAANTELKFIAKTAHDLGLNIRALEDSYKTLAAASMKTKLEGMGARDVFYAVAEASTAMQLTATQSHAALYALQQMMSKGRVQTEELRRQLGEQLPGAFQMAAEAMNVTTLELNYLLERGKVVSEDFLPKFAKVLHERFGKAAVRNADLARGAFNRFYNSVEQLKRALAESGLTEFFADLARVTSKVMDATTRIIKGVDPIERLVSLRKKLSDLESSKNVFATSAVREANVKVLEKEIKMLEGVALFQNKVAEFERARLIVRQQMNSKLDLQKKEIAKGIAIETAMNETIILQADEYAKRWWAAEEVRRNGVEERIKLEQKAAKELHDSIALTAKIQSDAINQSYVDQYDKMQEIKKSVADFKAEREQKYTDTQKMSQVWGYEGSLRSDKEIAEYERVAEEQKKIHQKRFNDMQKMNKLIGNESFLAAKAYKDPMLDALKEIEKTLKNVFKNIEDALVDFVMTGKFEFRSFALSVIEDIARIQAKALTSSLLGDEDGGLLGKIGSGLSSWLGGLGGTEYMTPTGGSPSGSMMPSFDTGGLMSSTGAKKPFPAIVHSGEVVGTPNQMSDMYGGSEGKITNIYINAIDTQTFNDYVKKNPDGIVTAIDENITSGGQLRSTIGGTL